MLHRINRGHYQQVYYLRERRDVLMNITTIDNIESDNGDAAGIYIIVEFKYYPWPTLYHFKHVTASNGTALEYPRGIKYLVYNIWENLDLTLILRCI